MWDMKVEQLEQVDELGYYSSLGNDHTAWLLLAVNGDELIEVRRLVLPAEFKTHEAISMLVTGAGR